MAARARICPSCGALNGADERHCYRCRRRLPGPLERRALDAYSGLLGSEAPATKLLIVINVAAFLFAAVEGWLAYQALPGLLGMPQGLGRRWGALMAYPGDLQSWRYLSANYVHFGLFHLGINMLMLNAFGRAIEERVGGPRLITLFVATGVGGFLASHSWSTLTNEVIRTGGASAGIAGLVGALIGYTFGQGNPAYKRLLTMVLVYGVLFAVLMAVQGVRINHAAHLGGLVVGALGGWALFVERRRRHATRQREAAYRWASTLLLVASVLSIAVARFGWG